MCLAEWVYVYNGLVTSQHVVNTITLPEHGHSIKEAEQSCTYRLEDGKSVLWELKHERSELL